MTDQSASNQSDIGYGQQNPNSSSSEFNAVAFLVAQMLGRIDTMKVVKVVKVTPGEGGGDVKKAGTVDVQPLVNQIDGSGNSTPHGIVHGIPWSRAQGGKNAVVCDPVVGDIGIVVVSDRDISAVVKTGQQSNPGSRRRYSLADGVYVGAALNVAPEQYLLFNDDGWRLVDKNENSIVSTSSGITLKPKVGLPVTVDGALVVNEVLTAKGNLNLTGVINGADGGEYAGLIKTSNDVQAGAISLKQHTHNQPNDSAGDSEFPTDPPNPGA